MKRQIQTYSTEAAKGKKLNLVCHARLGERCGADVVGEGAVDSEEDGDGEAEEGEADRGKVRLGFGIMGMGLGNAMRLRRVGLDGRMGKAQVV